MVSFTPAKYAAYTSPLHAWNKLFYVSRKFRETPNMHLRGPKTTDHSYNFASIIIYKQ